ncbi:hypothetical protein F5Y01DRAFT_312276 [Xylaria sp. FL0043]|nr:hypothetical protein F5Y01DRAFT_312276 [Xylaria sp. FL0043]
MDAAQLAIGLTGTTLKLFHFSFDFIKDAKQVYKQGTTARNADLSTIAKHVAIVTTRLEAQLEAMSGNGSNGAHALDPLEAQLRSLSQRAAEVGRELELKLQRVTTNKKSPWKSFKVVALGMWDASEIGKIEKRLNAINNEIQSGVLVDLQKRFKQSHDENTSRVLDTLEEFSKSLAHSRRDSTNIIELLNSADKVGKGRHEELLNAIHAMPVSSSPSYTLIPPTLPALQNESVRQAAEKIILNCLWYPKIQEREETISKAHADTFQWIFEDPKQTEKPWASFVDFLKGDGSSYWITGKPGSGKSTLMKFVGQNRKTQDLLQIWTGERSLVHASFYFFYGGDQNQKSELGLCRSLLHSILNERRELIPIAFKHRFQAALEGKRHDDPSLQEAKKALKDLILDSPNINFFFSIDGLDEFDPKVSMTKLQSLIEFTHFLGGCKNVKLIVSSRPLVEFESGYNGRDSLRIHDLTKKDIRRYAHEKLATHRRMKTLEKQYPNIMDELLQPIVESSLGVFLWVRVVVECLIGGLTNCDSVNDLKQSLRGLPSDLQDLYSTILGRMRPSYKQEAARLLYFVYHMHGNYRPFSLLDLWFAENSDDDMVRTTPIEPIKDEDLRDRLDGLKTRLKSRCLGLIETADRTDEASDHRLTNYSLDVPVRLFHRSVHEFLSQRDVWDEVVKKHLNYAFSVKLSLFRSAILIIKTYQSPPGFGWENIASLGMRAGRRAARAEQETKQSHRELVEELDLAMHGIMPLVRRLASNRGAISKPSFLPDPTCHWSIWCRLSKIDLWDHTQDLWPLNDITHGSLMAFATEYDLKYYIQDQVAENGRGVLNKEGLPLLGYALMPFDLYPHENNFRNVEVIQLLLREEQDPNQLYNGTSLWQWFLWTLPFDHVRDDSHDSAVQLWMYPRFISILEALLLAKANPDGRMIFTSKDGVALSEGDARELPWAPRGCRYQRATVCTILLALIRAHQTLRHDIMDVTYEHPKWMEESDKIIQKMIAFLKERGAMEKEWTDLNVIKPMFDGVCERMSVRKGQIVMLNDFELGKLRRKLSVEYHDVWHAE